MNDGIANNYNIYTVAIYKDDEFNGFYGKPYAYMLATEEEAKKVAE